MYKARKMRQGIQIKAKNESIWDFDAVSSIDNTCSGQCKLHMVHI